MKRKLIILLALAMLVSGLTALRETFPCGNYLRLHVLANSDRLCDQRLKYQVRDAVVAAASELLRNAPDAKTARLLAEEHLAIFQEAAERVVRAKGYDYPVTVCVGEFDFPDRRYGDLFLPEGIYQAVQIRIGQAAGHNWWCVLYPPLCLGQDGKTLRAAPEITPEPRFFLLEKWEQMRGREKQAGEDQKENQKKSEKFFDFY